jgi:N6-adenosine-specific RNA methylase IME4
VVAAPRPVDGAGKVVHSKKPDVFRAHIEQLFGPSVRKVELFARGTPAPGWDSWGNEIDLPEVA